jgi:large subunit ribosomal protein L4
VSTLTVDVRGADGSVRGSVALDDGVFGAQPNVPLMHQVVTAQLAAARRGTQSTKTRAEVSGGGAKPYKQKGTGRARQGSTRAPHYAGGGVALGPKPRSYRQHTPRKMVQLALRCALSDRAASGRIAVVDAWEWAEPSTKAAKKALAALGVTGRVLVVLSRDDHVARKSFHNLPDVDLTLAGELSAYDVLRSDWVVFSRLTVPGVSGWAAAPPAEATPDAQTGTSATKGSADAPALVAATPAPARAPTKRGLGTAKETAEEPSRQAQGVADAPEEGAHTSAAATTEVTHSEAADETAGLPEEPGEQGR